MTDKQSATNAPWTAQPLTPARFGDLEAVLGPHGAQDGCWCSWFHLTNELYARMKGEPARRLMLNRLDAGVVPGLLAYEGKTPVGWCAVEPRTSYARLARSRILKPVDDQPVWSMVCFFVTARARGRGLVPFLTRAAADHAAARGARILEAYPMDPGGRRISPADAFHGLAPTLARLGFAECARRSPNRPIMRLALD